ncbi:hypothetical protein LTR62_005315 [Meristemomyces frigidus]|uniref:Major facilitator superfamily (MFS) profile domain-containing protein n=1 Tax=Meristemomyces frigidus TaxID=1508187 RepID=A0AAN7TPW1_9PEZI|nr:hypothetical protein LTR62_005315 [Meristemomyces frigidus]
MGDQSWTQEEDKRLMRKVDWRLVPILFICADLSGLDKTAISSAALYGLRENFGLTGAQYSCGGSAPFFGALAFMGPSAYCLKQFPAIAYFSFNILMWGVTAMCMTACTSFGGGFVCRFLLGGFEALLIPAVILIVSQWYTPSEQPKRNAIVLNVIAPIINGFVAWLVSYHKSSLPGWKINFLSLGAFTMLWSSVTFRFIPNNLLDTPWLSSRQRYMIIQRKSGDNTGVESPSFKFGQVLEALLDLNADGSNLCTEDHPSSTPKHERQESGIHGTARLLIHAVSDSVHGSQHSFNGLLPPYCAGELGLDIRRRFINTSNSSAQSTDLEKSGKPSDLASISAREVTDANSVEYTSNSTARCLSSREWPVAPQAVA